MSKILPAGATWRDAIATIYRMKRPERLSSVDEVVGDLQPGKELAFVSMLCTEYQVDGAALTAALQQLVETGVETGPLLPAPWTQCET